MATAITTTLPTGTRHVDAGASQASFGSRGMFGLVGVKARSQPLSEISS